MSAGVLDPEYRLWLEWQGMLRAGQIPLHANGRVNWFAFKSKEDYSKARRLWHRLFVRDGD